MAHSFSFVVIYSMPSEW